MSSSLGTSNNSFLTEVSKDKTAVSVKQKIELVWPRCIASGDLNLCGSFGMFGGCPVLPPVSCTF